MINVNVSFNEQLFTPTITLFQFIAVSAKIPHVIKYNSIKLVAVP